MGKEIKAVIFDLDDTLFDSSNTCVKRALKEVSRTLAKEIKMGQKALLKELEEERERRGFINGLDSILKNKGAKNISALKKKAERIYYKTASVGKIKPFKDVKKTLAYLRSKGIKICLLTAGDKKRQIKKVNSLGIKDFFDLILIDSAYTKSDKDSQLQSIIKKLKVPPSEIVSVGNRPDKEIKSSKLLGMKTVRVMKGKYSTTKPRTRAEKADYTIREFKDFLRIIRRYY